MHTLRYPEEDLSNSRELACHAGDVVLARSMQNPKQIVCKRVLGLEGDEVRIPQSTQLGPGRTVVVRLEDHYSTLP